MSRLIAKYPEQHNTGEYYYFESEALIKDTDLDVKYFSEFLIIDRIKENEEGYFDFNKSLVDIGAHLGGYTMLLNFKHNYCFEPNKKVLCLLYANTYLKDKVDNTDIYNCCLSDIEGDINYNGFCCEGSGSPDEKKIELFGEMHKTTAKTLDSFTIENVGLIKIDVEGFEEKVIRGGLGTILRNNYPPILFECWDVGHYNMTQEKRDSLFNLLKSLGYEIFEYWGDFETHLAVHKSQLEKNNQ